MNRWVSYDEISFGDEIGRGNYGAVKKGKYKGVVVAVKELFPEDGELVKYFQREVNMLSLARHPNIVEFIGISKTPEGNFLILTEFCELEGDLHQVLKKEKVPWERRLDLAFHIAKAMSFLHGRGIIHRDLKCENILITKDWEVKVCDFGFARKMEQTARQMTICGTDWTMAPEIILEGDYNEKADVFSFGVVLAEIASRIAPDMKNFSREIPSFGISADEIRNKAEPGAPAKFVELAVNCTKVQGFERPSFIQALSQLQVMMDEAGIAPPSFAPSIATDSSNAEGIYEEDIEKVIIKRMAFKNDKREPYFQYQIHNQRSYPVRVTLQIEDEDKDCNASIQPLGPSMTVSEGKVIEGLVLDGQEVIVAQVEMKNSSKPGFSFHTAVQIDRCDTEFRKDDIQGVVLQTAIEHGFIRQISFHVENTRDFDIQVELEVEGKALSYSCPFPVNKIVPAHQRIFLGSIKSNDGLSSSWSWKQVPKRELLHSVLKGVQLLRSPLELSNGNAFKVEVTNTRKRKVMVEIKLDGTFNLGEGYQNPLRGEVRPEETALLGTFASTSEVAMDWSWKEL